ncbi:MULTISPECIES: head-tail joining protein [Photobacterium]|uniref:head-tail joining protein n=1 Tax=Photobacterium TaxID=657 RepID=UPI000D15B910|nr:MULTISPECIES: head-tail joining protein [Photobacterium]
MFDFESALKKADNIIFETFANVTVTIEGRDNPVPGIFDNPSAISSLPGGGQISDRDNELFLQSHNASGISRRTLVTLTFSDGTVKTYQVKNPEPDGTGLVKLTLGNHHGEQSQRSPIPY